VGEAVLVVSFDDSHQNIDEREKEQDSDYGIPKTSPFEFKGFLGTFRALDLGHRRLERKDWRVSERRYYRFIFGLASTNYAGEARTHLVSKTFLQARRSPPVRIQMGYKDA
jgi:hypothetical protein